MEDLLPIGKLSKMLGLSIDTLRYYDEISLISPAHVDTDSGYRYYALHQAADFAKVQELKEYGFSLKEIKALPQTDTAQIFQQRYAALIKQQAKLQATINKLAHKIKQQQEVLFMQKQILLVDDAIFMRKVCRDIFTNNGYQIAGEADTGHATVNIYSTMQPDAVVMNITMPEMDGISALREIRKLHPQANVIMLSAMGQPAMVVEALLAGAQSFIVKPFQAETLLAAVQNSFGGERIYKPDVLEGLLTYYPARDVLSQTQINQIMHTALTADNAEEALAMMDSLNERDLAAMAVN